jgi:hypothetical protein
MAAHPVWRGAGGSRKRVPWTRKGAKSADFRPAARDFLTIAPRGLGQTTRAKTPAVGGLNGLPGAYNLAPL